MKDLLTAYSDLLQIFTNKKRRRVSLVELSTYLDIEKGAFWPNSEQHLTEELGRRYQDQTISDIDILVNIGELMQELDPDSDTDIISLKNCHRLYEQFEAKHASPQKINIKSNKRSSFIEPNDQKTKPTDEQQVIIDVLTNNSDTLKLQGYAGCGKTSVISMAHINSPRDTQLNTYYMAFNKGIVHRIENSIPNITAITFDALGYRLGLDKSPWSANDIGFNRPSNVDISRYLGIQPYHALDGNKELKGNKISKLTSLIVDNFINSSDEKPLNKHIPPEIQNPSAREQLLFYARTLWDAYVTNSFGSGNKTISPAYVTKYWSLLGGTLPSNCERLFLDEAQDINGSFYSILKNSKTTQIIAAGDHYQQLYGWRGAVNSMALIDGKEFSITKSFRYGSNIANLANQILSILTDKSSHEITSFNAEKVSKVNGCMEPPPICDVILTRGRASVFSLAKNLAESNKSFYLNLDFSEFSNLLISAYYLFKGEHNKNTHAKLSGFSMWSEMLAYAETAIDSDLLLCGKLIERHADTIIVDLENIQRRAAKYEDDASVVLSTTHRIKGRDWKRVGIAEDFLFCLKHHEDRETLNDELKILYVAITRARDEVYIPYDLLAWITEKKV